MLPRQFRDVNRIGLAVVARFRERERESEKERQDEGKRNNFYYAITKDKLPRAATRNDK